MADRAPRSLQELAGAAASRAEWMAVIRADQRRRWLRGRPLPLETYLAEFPGLANDPAALLDLVHNEMALREELGERSRRDEYLRRFPALAGALERTLALSDELSRSLPVGPTTSLGPGSPEPVADPPSSGGTVEQDASGRREAAEGSLISAFPRRVAPTKGLRYRILRPLAKGGLGEVFVAEDSELNREVALKEILAFKADDPDCRARFLLEAEVTGRLEHPGIVPVHGLGTYADGRPYYAMRLVKGESLKDAIQRSHDPAQANRPAGERLLELRQLLGRFVAVCNAVAYAHSKGVLHRDLKPANVMLGPYGETLIVDWGLAKLIDRPEVEAPAPDDPLPPPGPLGDVRTRAGSRVGTPGFMSPEQAAGLPESVGPASDVYSLGAVLYVLLTGELPFDGTRLSAILDKICRGDFPPPRQIDPRVPAALDAVCRKAMALQPADRYATATDLAADVERWLADEPVSARRETFAERLARLARRYRSATRVGAVSLAVLALVATVALVLVSTARRDEARAYAVRELTRDISDGLRSADWSQGHLDAMDGLADRLAAYDPTAAEKARASTREVFARAIANDFGGELDAPTRQRIEGRLDLLEARDPFQADELRRDYRQRLGQWHPRFDLRPPFDTLGSVFDLSHVQVEAGFVFARPASGPTGPLVRTRVPSAGPVQLEAAFAPSWSSAPVVGLLLNDGDAGRYQFLVCVPEYIPGQDEGNLSKPSTLAATLKGHERVRACILRDNAVLSETLLDLPAGELRLFAGRSGDRLTFQVNRLKPLEFADPFPLRPDRPGAFGVVWAPGVGLKSLRGERQLLPAQPSPLERGDELYVQGEFDAALALYREQARVAGDTPLGQQARYKQAVCLADLGREDEAVSIWKELFVRLPANPNAEGARWSVQAACRLWLWHLKNDRRDDADHIAEALPGSYTTERLAAMVPAELRKGGILDQLRLRGPRWRSAYKADDDIDRLKRAMRAEELLNESPFERHLTAWRLADAYRINHQTDQALLIMVELLADTNLAPDERLVFSRDLVWIYLEDGRAAEALRKADELVEQAGTNPALQPLHLDRARALVALNRKAEAGQEVEAFFATLDRSQIDYSDFADACLLRGFLRADRGDEQGSQAAWREGLYRNWPGGIPPMPKLHAPSGIALNNRGNAITFAIQLGSLVGEMDRKEADTLLQHLMSGTGTAEATVRTLARKSFPEEFVWEVMTRNARPPHGREIARKMAYRQIDLYRFFIDPLRVSIAEGLKVSAKLPPITPELEDIIWKATQDLIDYYNKGIIDDEQIQQILHIWTGRSDPEREWSKLAPKLEPDLRIPCAAYFGCRYLKLDKPAVAERFFREVLEREKKDKLLYRLAAEELAKLKPTRP